MIRTTKNLLLLSILAGASLAANAWGQAAAPPQMMDTDGDGLVSVKEHAAGAKAMFERMDANHDGNVTAAEMDAAHALMMKRVGGMHGTHPMPGMGMGMGPGMPAGGMMAMMDSNHDGAITAQEHAAHAKAMFDRMDANRDGKVTAGEITAGHEMMTKEARIVHRGPGMPGKGMDMDMGPGMGPGMSSADRIGKMDRNGDGRLSAAEHAAGAQAMFDEADTNKDGKLSKEERWAHHGEMMKH